MRGATGTIISERMSRKILETARAQQDDMRVEEQKERRAGGKGSAPPSSLPKASRCWKQSNGTCVRMSSGLE